MAMLSALYSGVAGLSTYGKAMSVIGDNIANVNTTAFKMSRANFADVMVRSLATGAAGTNEVGFGNEISSLQSLHSQGSFESTESATDLAIGGSGFFKVRHPSTGVMYYTRAGQFHFDAEGFLVTPKDYVIQGYLADIVTGAKVGAVTDIKISGQRSNPNASSRIDMSLNLDSQETVPATAFDPTDDTTYNYSTAVTVYDSLGTPRTLTIYFRKGSSTGQHQLALANIDPAGVNNALTYTAQNYGGEGELISIQYLDGGNTGTSSCSVAVAGNAITITITASAGGYPPASRVATTVNGNAAASGLVSASNTPPDDGTGIATPPVGQTYLAGVDSGAYWDYYAYYRASDATSGVATAGSTGYLSFDTSGTLAAGTSAQATNDFDFIGATQNQAITLDYTPSGGIAPTSGVAGTSGTYYLFQDGYSQGSIESVAVDKNGIITGSFSNGELKRLGYIVLANFNNPEGLRREGGNLWAATTDAGTELLGDPRTLGLGEVNGSTLEQSNVDLAGEFVSMITNQRAYQANSRVITTSDQMLETLMQLKR